MKPSSSSNVKELMSCLEVLKKSLDLDTDVKTEEKDLGILLHKASEKLSHR